MLRDLNKPATKISSICRIVSIEPDDVTIRPNVANLRGSHFRKGQVAGLDVAIFPRLFLPSTSSAVGERHASLLLPIWLEKDWGQWSAFGGGGCEINRGGVSQNFCLMGLTVTRQFTTRLQLGLEIFHQTPDTQGGLATTSLGIGARYDLNDNFHLLGYAGRGIQNVAQT